MSAAMKSPSPPAAMQDEPAPGLADLLADLGKAAEETVATLSDGLVGAEQSVREGLEQAEETIRQHPLLAIGLAAGLGFALGLILSGSGRSDDD